MYKPDGYTDLSPYLVVEDAQAVLSFAETALGATRLRVFEEGGRVRHAELRIGDSVLMMGESPGGAPANLHLYLADPDEAFARAVEAGAEVVQAMEDKDDGDRRGGVRDASGTTWWLARQTG